MGSKGEKAKGGGKSGKTPADRFDDSPLLPSGDYTFMDGPATGVSEPTLRERLRELQAEFDSYRQRTEADAARQATQQADMVAVALLDIVDDCDRALSQLSVAGVSAAQIASGLEQMRDRVVRHFVKLGFEPFGERGDGFDPRYHEAIATEPGEGPDGAVLKVHRRGWMKADGQCVRPATVTVLQGTKNHDEEMPALTPASGYVCPYGIPGCDRDCPGCSPAD